MKVFAFALQKGGTGKTSSAVSVAYELSKHGRTLLIDADPQGNATTWLDFSTIQYEFADLLKGDCTIEQCCIQTNIDNLYIIPTAGIDGNLKKVGESADLQDAPFMLDDLRPDFEKHFDFIIYDLSPNFGALEKCCLLACDRIITVLQCTDFAKDGLQIFTSRLQETKHKRRVKDTDRPLITDIIINAKDERKTLQKIIYEQLQPLAKIYTLHTIPLEPAFEKAQAMHEVLQNFEGVKKETLQAVENIAANLMK